MYEAVGQALIQWTLLKETEELHVFHVSSARYGSCAYDDGKVDGDEFLPVSIPISR